MAQPKPASDLLSVEDYLTGENDGTRRHEFVDGFVYAMAGASERHNFVTGDVFSVLNLALTSECRAFSGDMKLRVQDLEASRFYYPDVFVSCGPGDETQYFRSDAVLVIEVLSETTRRADRYEKFDAYKRLPSLAEYALIEQEFPQVEIFRRKHGWRREVYQTGDIVMLDSIHQSLTFEQIYRRVKFAP